MESSSSDSDKIAVSVCMDAAAYAGDAEAAQQANRIESRPGRAGNRELGVFEASKPIDKDYFCRHKDSRPLFPNQSSNARSACLVLCTNS